jgi:hypothetical protein
MALAIFFFTTNSVLIQVKDKKLKESKEYGKSGGYC